jgi:pimeloyl-ACP methyl ester carboxylesterase
MASDTRRHSQWAQRSGCLKVRLWQSEAIVVSTTTSEAIPPVDDKGSEPQPRTTNRRRFLIGSALVGGGAVAGGAVGYLVAPSSPAAAETKPTLKPPTKATSPFNSSTFNQEGLFVLGAAGCNTADVGEVLTTFDNINARTGNPSTLAQSDFDTYVDEFAASSNQLATLAQSASAAGMMTTAKYQHLRTSNYMTQALFFVLGTSKPGTEEQLFDIVNQHWQAALTAMTPAPIQFTVQGPSYTIPVYLFRPDDSGTPRPTLIISDGSDGQNVETMQFGVVAGLERGYNVALFEGPGQMSLLFKEKIPFTADWDQIVGPVVEALAGRADVQSDRVGLIGLSFAGMLCARAAARTPGLAAVVLEPAAIQMSKLWDDQTSIKAVMEVQGAPAAIRAKVEKEVNAGFIKAWPHLSPVEQFTIHKRSEIFTTQALEDARASKPPSDYFGVLEAFLPFDYTDDYKAITIPTLLTANQGDPFFGDQPHQAYALLDNVAPADKKLIQFTDAEGAQLHDQPMAPQFAQEAIFGWLDPYLQG